MEYILKGNNQHPDAKGRRNETTILRSKLLLSVVIPIRNLDEAVVLSGRIDLQMALLQHETMSELQTLSSHTHSKKQQRNARTKATSWLKTSIVRWPVPWVLVNGVDTWLRTVRTVRMVLRVLSLMSISDNLMVVGWCVVSSIRWNIDSRSRIDGEHPAYTP